MQCRLGSILVLSGVSIMKRCLRGTVVGASCTKTVRVNVERVFRHPQYGKILRRTVVCYAHDDLDVAVLGDVVDVVECRPMSRLKRWALVRVV